MSDKKKFIELIIKNLNSNGFPTKKVSFDIEKMYEMADNRDLSFNDVLDILANEHNIQNEKTVDKIIFFKEVKFCSKGPELNPDMMAQAQEMMANMSPEEMKNIQSMYENMSDEEKQKIMEQAKKMGLF